MSKQLKGGSHSPSAIRMEFNIKQRRKYIAYLKYNKEHLFMALQNGEITMEECIKILGDE
jgi:hypothetical protein